MIKSIFTMEFLHEFNLLRCLDVKLKQFFFQAMLYSISIFAIYRVIFIIHTISNNLCIWDTLTSNFVLMLKRNNIFHLVLVPGKMAIREFIRHVEIGYRKGRSLSKTAFRRRIASIILYG